jgi:hypothetical protein
LAISKPINETIKFTENAMSNESSLSLTEPGLPEIFARYIRCKNPINPLFISGLYAGLRCCLDTDFSSDNSSDLGSGRYADGFDQGVCYAFTWAPSKAASVVSWKKAANEAFKQADMNDRGALNDN